LTHAAAYNPRTVQLPPLLAGRRSLLVVAHPGHELRVHGWVETARPEVWVLTDGSGHGESSRLDSSRTLLGRAGATVGSVFGRWSDREAYRILLERDVAAVDGLVRELAAALVARQVDYVVGDAWEGFNPVHDLCRLIVDAAVVVAERRGDRAVADFEFALEGSPQDWAGGGEALVWDLDDEGLARKLAAAHAYPELAEEVARAVAAHGAAAFRTERLHRVVPLGTLSRVDGRPLFERFGEERVAAGHYTQVLRHAEHFAPLASAVSALALATPANGGQVTGEGAR
jgi:hypothetical protein